MRKNLLFISILLLILPAISQASSFDSKQASLMENHKEHLLNSNVLNDYENCRHFIVQFARQKADGLMSCRQMNDSCKALSRVEIMDVKSTCGGPSFVEEARAEITKDIQKFKSTVRMYQEARIKNGCQIAKSVISDKVSDAINTAAALNENFNSLRNLQLPSCN